MLARLLCDMATLLNRTVQSLQSCACNFQVQRVLLSNFATVMYPYRIYSRIRTAQFFCCTQHCIRTGSFYIYQLPIPRNTAEHAGRSRRCTRAVCPCVRHAVCTSLSACAHIRYTCHHNHIRYISCELHGRHHNNPTCTTTGGQNHQQGCRRKRLDCPGKRMMHGMVHHRLRHHLMTMQQSLPCEWLVDSSAFGREMLMNICTMAARSVHTKCATPIRPSMQDTAGLQQSLASVPRPARRAQPSEQSAGMAYMEMKISMMLFLIMQLLTDQQCDHMCGREVTRGCRYDSMDDIIAFAVQLKILLSSDGQWLSFTCVRLHASSRYS